MQALVDEVVKYMDESDPSWSSSDLRAHDPIGSYGSYGSYGSEQMIQSAVTEEISSGWK